MSKMEKLKDILASINEIALARLVCARQRQEDFLAILRMFVEETDPAYVKDLRFRDLRAVMPNPPRDVHISFDLSEIIWFEQYFQRNPNTVMHKAEVIVPVLATFLISSINKNLPQTTESQKELIAVYDRLKNIKFKGNTQES